MKSAFLSTLLAAAMSVGAASSPALPLTPIPGSSGCNSLAIDGDRLFAANSSKLTVYDISNPLRPRQCGTMPLRGARQITVNGNHLYVSARHWGVQIIDISEPDSPKPAGWLDTAELATGMESAGNLLCVTLRVYGRHLQSPSPEGDRIRQTVWFRRRCLGSWQLLLCRDRASCPLRTESGAVRAWTWAGNLRYFESGEAAPSWRGEISEIL